MPLFEYRGFNKSGKNVRGTIDADNSRTAKIRLKKQGVYITQLKNKSEERRQEKRKKKVSTQKVGTKDISMMTRQLATLLKANIPLVDSLLAISEQLDNKTFAEIMAEVKNMVNEGTPFHKSLEKYPKIFNKVYLSMCEAGETSGTLDIILIRLAEFTESQNKLTSQVRSAMTYPLILLSMSILILAGIFTYVIPKIVTVFEATPELTLPWFTIAIIDLQKFITSYWLFIFMFIGLAYFIFRNWKKTPYGKTQWDRIKLNLPVTGKLLRLIAISRFSQTLSTLLNGGVPMISSMNIVRNVVNNDILAKAIDNARDNITEGESIAGPLKKSNQFPPMVIHMINIGEKTGELETMLTQVSHSYDFQVDTEINTLTSILEPAMIVFMGGVIMVIVLTILIPLFDLINLGG